MKCEGVGIRGIERILKIAENTILKRINLFADSIPKSPAPRVRQEFEVYELRTYVDHKGDEYWVIYALNRSTGDVVDYIVGKRNKQTLRTVINTLRLSGAKRIYTDNLEIYKSIMPKDIHFPGSYLINHIERRNPSSCHCCLFLKQSADSCIYIMMPYPVCRRFAQNASC